MERYLAKLSWTEIQALKKDLGVVLLPIGATEQHGPHLPIMTDTRQLDGVLAAALARLPKEVFAWVLPTLPFGKSNEHLQFPGTLSLSAETLRSVLQDIARSVRRAGFKRLAFINGHGGNVAVLDAAARDIRLETGLMCFCIQPAYWLQPPFEMSDQEARYGIHAGELETSLMLALEPGLVNLQAAVKHYPDLEGIVQLTGSASVAWLSHDVSETGVFGDATRASQEKGQMLLAHASERLAKVIAEMSCFEVSGG